MTNLVSDRAGPPGGTATAPRPAGGKERPGSSVRRALRYAAPALLAYAAVRVLGVAVLEAWSAEPRKAAYTLLSGRWDSVWYARIAEHGYGFTVRTPDGEVHSDLAFFPLFPALERAVATVLPLDVPAAGLVIAAFSSLLAAWGLFAVGERLYSRRTGVVLAVVWAALPIGIVQSMAYTESLFTAFAAWALYAVLTGRWVPAGVLASLSGLTRPTGAAVAASVVVAAVVTVVPVVRRSGPGRAVRAHPTALLGVLIAPLGWLGYIAWVGVRQGDPAAYLDVQAQWGNGFDGGLAFAGFIRGQLTGSSVAAGVGLVAAMTLVGWLYALCVWQRQPVALLVYGAAMMVLAFCGAGYFGSKPRLLMPAFSLLLPVAVALAGLRMRWIAPLLAAAALGSAVYGAFWLHGPGPP